MLGSAEGSGRPRGKDQRFYKGIEWRFFFIEDSSEHWQWESVCLVPFVFAERDEVIWERD